MTVSKKELNTLYWEKGLSQNEIADIYSVAKITIQYWMYKYKIPRRPKGFTTKRMRKKISLIQKGKRHSPRTEFKPKIDLPKKQLEKLYLEENLSMRQIGKLYDVTRKAIKRRLKKFDIPIRSTREEYDQLRIKNLMIRPTRPEEKFIKMINKNKLPYKYVGDGEFILGGKCPDFLNCDGKKQIIEIFGRVFHDPEKTFRKNLPYNRTERGTIEHYMKYGFNCLVIWEEELADENKILDKLGGFK